MISTYEIHVINISTCCPLHTHILCFSRKFSREFLLRRTKYYVIVIDRHSQLESQIKKSKIVAMWFKSSKFKKVYRYH